jgi:hypothetical protein
LEGDRTGGMSRRRENGERRVVKRKKDQREEDL